VTLAGRSFTIRKQFVDDITENKNTNVAHLRRPLLVMHSPVDTIVPIQQAEKIFVAAKHPKSFVSLDNADHLLSKKEDAEYVATAITGWASRYILDNSPVVTSHKLEKGHLRVSEHDHRFAQLVQSDDHQWIADEPVAVGGNNSGPDPYEHLLAALGTCTVMTLRMYANRKKWPVEKISIELEHTRDHGSDCQECDDTHSQIDIIKRTISIIGDLKDEDHSRMMEIADKCPVHRTLHNKLVIRTEY